MHYEHVREEDMERVATEILAAARGNVIALTGELGAGKTTLARTMLRKSGHDGRVMSPTFIIACEYQLDDRLIQHLDFYRVEEYAVLLDLGLEEMLDTADLVLIEWAEKFIAELRRSGAAGLHVQLADDGQGGRNIDVQEL